VTFRLPGMDDVVVRQGIRYQPAADGLLMDVYCPPAGAADTRAPVVVIVFGYPDPQSGIRMFGPMTSWARLMAASGMAAVLYGTNAPADDVHALLGYLRANAGSLGIDDRRIGLFATSANVSVALSALMGDPKIACAAFLYGYTFEAPGSTAFADASKQYGYVDATAGRTIDELPTEIPMCVIRAGLEQFPGVNAALDHFAASALARNMPLTFVNHATGAHGFDVDDNREAARRVVRQLVEFLRLNLA